MAPTVPLGNFGLGLWGLLWSELFRFHVRLRRCDSGSHRRSNTGYAILFSCNRRSWGIVAKDTHRFDRVHKHALAELVHRRIHTLFTLTKSTTARRTTDSVQPSQSASNIIGELRSSNLCTYNINFSAHSYVRAPRMMTMRANRAPHKSTPAGEDSPTMTVGWLKNSPRNSIPTLVQQRFIHRSLQQTKLGFQFHI